MILTKAPASLPPFPKLAFWVFMVSYLVLMTGCAGTNWAVPASMGNIQEAKKFILAGKGLDETDIQRDTPFLWAARNGQPDIVKLFLGRSVNINEANRITGETALILAVKGNHLGTVALLLEHGADLNIKDNTGYSALEWASQKGNMGALAMLMGKSPQSSASSSTGNPVVAAVYSGQLSVVQHLVDKGYTVNAADIYGDTPYLAAVKMGDPQIVNYLEKHGAETRGTDGLGRTPLMLAAQAGHVDIVRHLIEQGVNLNEASRNGYTPLMFASANGHYDMAHYLLERGADPNRLDTHQRNAVFLSAFSGHWHITKLLLNRGARFTPELIPENDRSPYVMAPLYEIAGEYFLENNNKPKAMEFYGLSENMYRTISDDYSDRATQEALLRGLQSLGMVLLASGLTIAEHQQAKTQARETAQMSALKDAHTSGQYHQLYAAMLPKYERQEEMHAIAASQANPTMRPGNTVGNPNQKSLAYSEKELRHLAQQAAQKASKVQAMLRCIRETDDNSLRNCSPPLGPP